MKKCCRCKEVKDVCEFTKNASQQDGLSAECKGCKAEYNRKYYQEHKEQSRLRDKRRIQRLRDYVLEVLQSRPCADCGEDNILVLEFDHISDKKYNIGDMICHPSTSLIKLEQEIAKCEIRCANCHRVKTAYQVNSWRLKFLSQ